MHVIAVIGFGFSDVHITLIIIIYVHVELQQYFYPNLFILLRKIACAYHVVTDIGSTLLFYKCAIILFERV